MSFQRLAVYCGSASPADPLYMETAREVGRALVARICSDGADRRRFDVALVVDPKSQNDRIGREDMPIGITTTVYERMINLRTRHPFSSMRG